MAVVVYNSLSAISPETEDLNIRVQIIRLWKVMSTTSKLPFTLEMVLMDESGSKIQASMKKTLFYKFEKRLEETKFYIMRGFEVVTNSGDHKTSKHEYKLNFKFTTYIQALHQSIPMSSPYTFTPFSEIMSPDFDKSYLVDVIGVVTYISAEREFVSNNQPNKMVVLDLHQEGAKIECALFGTYVDDLNAYRTLGYGVNSIIVIQFAKAKVYRGAVGLQNAKHTTKILFEPDIPETLPFKQRLLESNGKYPQVLTQTSTPSPRVSAQDDFLKITPRKTVGDLKDISEDCSVVILGTIHDVHEGQDWWYTACQCGKSVYPDSQRYYCEGCNRHVVDVCPRYRIKVSVSDDTDSAMFVIFEREAAQLLMKSCHEMLESTKKVSGCNTFPLEILSLVNKTFLFKVGVKIVSNSRFEPSFPVKRLSDDPILIQRFISMNSPEATTSEASLGGVNLMNEFRDINVEKNTELHCLEIQESDVAASSNKLITCIKKEKDDAVLSKSMLSNEYQNSGTGTSKRLSCIDVEVPHKIPRQI